MSVTTTAHLNFRGDARAALEFYQSVFGGQSSIATYADIHAVESPEQAQQVSFGRLSAPNGFDIMAHDVQTSKATTLARTRSTSPCKARTPTRSPSCGKGSATGRARP